MSSAAKDEQPIVDFFRQGLFVPPFRLVLVMRSMATFKTVTRAWGPTQHFADLPATVTVALSQPSSDMREFAALLDSHHPVLLDFYFHDKWSSKKGIHIAHSTLSSNVRHSQK